MVLAIALAFEIPKSQWKTSVLNGYETISVLQWNAYEVQMEYICAIMVCNWLISVFRVGSEGSLNAKCLDDVSVLVHCAHTSIHTHTHMYSTFTWIEKLLNQNSKWLIRYTMRPAVAYAWVCRWKWCVNNMPNELKWVNKSDDNCSDSAYSYIYIYIWNALDVIAFRMIIVWNGVVV